MIVISRLQDVSVMKILRADRQPEFTQIDMELSFVDVDDVMDVNERLLHKLFKEVLDVDVELPIQRMTWQEAMDRFGSDKPDLRFGMELKDVSEVVKGCGFGVFTGALENGGSVRGINAKGQGAMPRKKIDALVKISKRFWCKRTCLSLQSMKMEATNLLLQNS